jgi:hypothetical protein
MAQITKFRSPKAERIGIGQQISTWIDDPTITGERLAMLVVLMNHASETGVCWPSQKRLAGLLGWGRGKVGQVISDLIDLGHLGADRRQREDGGNSSLRYQIIAARFGLELTQAPLLENEAGGSSDISQGDARIPSSRTSSISNLIPLNADVLKKASQENQREDASNSVISATWTPSAATLDRAKSDRPDIDVAACLEKFQEHFDGYVLPKPDSRFMNWVRDERACKQKTRGEGTRFGSAHTQKDPGNILAGRQFRKGSDHPDPNVRALAAMNYGARYGLARRIGQAKGWSKSEIQAAARDPELLSRSEIQDIVRATHKGCETQ